MLSDHLVQPALPPPLSRRFASSVAVALCRGSAAAAVATLINIVPVSAQTDTQNNPSQEQKTDEQKGKEPGTSFRMAPVARPPAVTRPTVIQRPAVQQREFSRPTSRGGKPTIRSGVKATTRKGTAVKTGPEEKKVHKPTTVEKPVSKPVSVDKPAVVDQPVTKPVAPVGQTDRPSSFAGKPETVAHNPLHNDGQLGKATDHKPQTIEKYGKYYTRSYYSTTTEGETTWYWYDVPLNVVPPVTNIPVCNGDTDDCPAPQPPVLADDKPKLKEEKGDDKKEEKKPKTLQQIVEEECPGGTVVAGHAYSVCVGKTWHVVSYDTFVCPPNNVYKRLKTLDIDTGQPCTTPYDPVDSDPLNFPRTAEGVPCGGKKDVDPPSYVIVIRCVDGIVFERKYRRAVCDNGKTALGTFVEETKTDQKCAGGGDWKPKLPGQFDGHDITEPKADGAKTDAKP